MAKSSLHALLAPNRDSALLFRQWLEALGAEVWVNDPGGALLYGTTGDYPADPVPVVVSGNVLGWVSGDSHAALAASWLSIMATQEDVRKKMGAEVLYLYREINLIYNFSEKLSSSVGKKSIAEMVLLEAGNLIPFQMGMVVFWENHPDDPEILAQRGKVSLTPEHVLTDNQRLREISQTGRPEIIQSPNGPAMLMSAPLRVEHRLLGAIMLADENRREFTAADLKLLNTLALQAASAIENAIQYEKAAEKTLELEREKLEKENLRQLDDLKSRFYTNITHEFRTPLTVILGMSNLPPNHTAVNLGERFDMIQRNGEHMLRLVDQLLDLSKLESGSVPVHWRHGDVVLFVRQLTAPFHLYASERDLSLACHAAQDQLNMDFDPDKLQQVLVNLLSNAIKFTPPGGNINITIRKSPENELLLSVSDTGTGIAPEHLSRIFDRFYQAHTGEPHGSGIGLAHSRELARLMGGDVTAESVPGTGSVFTVRLPIHTAASGNQNQPAGATHTEAYDPDNAGKPLLLIVEDNPDIARYLQTCLEPTYQTVIATDGISGISQAIDLVPDLIVSDVMMPGADGYDVCHTLKSDVRTSHIPIVLLSAKADARSKMEGLRRGADAYLGKPFDMEELLVHLHKLLELRKKLQTHYVGKALESNPTEPGVDDDAVENTFLRRLKDTVEAHLSDEKFGLAELCRAMSMSRSQLFRKMKALINEAPSSYIRMYRLHRAKTLLETTDLHIAEIAYAVGFSDPAYFSFAFNEAFGSTPSSIRAS